jgi:hypothetical protein
MRIHHVLALFALAFSIIACTEITNQVTQEAPVPGAPDLRVSVRVTAADLGAMGAASEWLTLTDNVPSDCRIQAFHVNVPRRFHFSGEAGGASALMLTAMDDGGETIGQVAIDDVHGIEGQYGEPARPPTYEETWPNPIGVWFKVESVNGDGQPGAPFSALATDEALAGDVTADVIFAAPALDVPQGDAGTD